MRVTDEEKRMRKELFVAAIVATAMAGSGAATARPERMMCPMIYKPVCAMTRYHRVVTFGNACLARTDHARILYNGRCSRRR